jgi:hypothetical protein
VTCPPFDEAWTGFAAASLLGVDDPEVAEWAATSRSIYAGLGARPMLAHLDAAVRRSGGGAATVEPASSPQGLSDREAATAT